MWSPSNHQTILVIVRFSFKAIFVVLEAVIVAGPCACPFPPPPAINADPIASLSSGTALRVALAVQDLFTILEFID